MEVWGGGEGWRSLVEGEGGDGFCDEFGMVSMGLEWF